MTKDNEMTDRMATQEDPGDLLADAYVRKTVPIVWRLAGRECECWLHVRAGIRLARENPL